MKNLIIIIFIFGFGCLITSCKKEQSVVKPLNMSAVTIVNAVSGSQAVVPDFSAQIVQYFSQAQTINVNSYFEYSVPSGSTPVSVWQLPDTTQSVFNGQLNLAPHGIYSLFLVGTNPSKPDTMLLRDNIPYYALGDSVAGVRFANISPGGNPVSVDIQGMANGSEVQSLAYKNATIFKTYKDTQTIPTSGHYIFEFRDAATGTLLKQYTYSSIARFRSVTIALSGLPGSQSVFLINNY